MPGLFCFVFLICMKRLFCFLLVVFACMACEKAIDFNLDEAPPKLVVEATIENNKPPVVYLSRSLNFFSAISPTLLLESFVHNAQVYVSNGEKIHQLREDSIALGAGFYFYYYSIDSANLSTAFEGELKKAYNLRIVYDGNEYTATTTIPDTTRRVDSLWWKPVPEQIDREEVNVFVRATDKPGFGDYIRYFTQRNGEPFYPAFNSVFDDWIIDGTTYELSVEPGFNRNIERNEEDYFFKRGDSVTLKIANIDKATYDFWRTMEYSYASVGNPFSTPVKVLGNISNGALGYFGGYAAQYHTIIIPE